MIACLAVGSWSAVPSAHDIDTRRWEIIFLAIAAGVGFGFIFVAFARTADDSGLWPLLAARVASDTCRWGDRSGNETRCAARCVRVIWLIIASGVLDMAANIFYIEASHRGLLTIVSVIASMYPVTTVCLAFGLDHERVSKSQAAGLAFAATALALVSLGS